MGALIEPGGSAQYIMAAPSDQNALDIFRGEWVSKFPGRWAGLQAGDTRFFEDLRIHLLLGVVGSVQGYRVLDLGPLEAGLAYMLEQRGAGSVLSIEASVRAYLKCLIVKEILGMNRVRFLCGDFVEFLRANQTKFDLCLASGVLYHMVNPVELISLVARAADRVLVWTHYYDPELVAANPALAMRFSGTSKSYHAGFEHTLYRHEYAEARGLSRFFGGGARHSNWMEREEILTCLEFFGFTEVRVVDESREPMPAPHFTVYAAR
jgi:hypothetical protein